MMTKRFCHYLEHYPNQIKEGRLLFLKVYVIELSLVSDDIILLKLEFVKRKIRVLEISANIIKS